MSLIKKKNFGPTFPQLFDDFIVKDAFDWGFKNHSATRTTLPSVNIVENNDGFLVEMAVPGMKKEDFLIELDHETLTISSQKESQSELKEDARYTRREFSYQSFTRTFHLPQSVIDNSKIDAKYEDGVLLIHIPKKEEAKKLPARKIEIQ